MRTMPVALALSLLALVSASTSYSAPPGLVDPRAATLEAQGREALVHGDAMRAIDGFEAALAIDPGSARLVLDLAEAARAQGLQGKALHYYRAVLDRDPRNLSAIAGEGAALAEKGALEKARRDLARLQNLCGTNCPEAQGLAAVIAKGPMPQMVSAEAVKPKGTSTD